ncbi:iron (metal) dependent repressor, DtxR family [Anaerocolumna jejuensis DSM 15929]|uniref:Manganese transport regulator n=1 Tax=Anaerocolumna jejuensis DSM 15929 TaxID=1121322 RepID=A0A1M6PI50_9FIRM|nr:metal-dependent transcriptional regulator [Anaerocolumna jejuensis]SHK07628.1 iron (metal) dependent repressor, DtxR family [Anaerocolumna jejuensis DSM 15929]
MTRNKEDYIKEIYKLGGAEQQVNNKQIAEILNVSPASVTEMLGKLQKEELIVYEPYKGTKLTEEGMKAAVTLLRGHRLWEVFLIEHLGYTWSEAHEDAERLEHVAPARLIDRLEKYLDYPAFCPHGNAIPQADGKMRIPKLKSLVEMQAGESSTIRRVTEENDLMDYLQELGIHIGSKVVVEEFGACEGPVTIRVDNTQKQLSYKAAGMVYVDEK